MSSAFDIKISTIYTRSSQFCATMPIENRIRKMRIDKNITQEELARAVGVSRQTIIAMEKGHYVPSLLLAMNLAKFFRISVEELFYKQ